MNHQKKIKRVRSPFYNYDFYFDSGEFYRWGKEFTEDPYFSPFGPEILDIEVSTICGGPTGNRPCSWCYKSNTKDGKNMSLENFVKIFKKIPKNLTQIAFGIGDLDANPDLIGMFEYCHQNKHNTVVPNITINGYNLTDYYLHNLIKYCGAVSVSRYEPKDVCYDAVKELTDRGLDQCNIHMLLSNETIDKCYELIEDSKTDKRLEKLNCIVFLMLKPKGKRNVLSTVDEYKQIEKLLKKAFSVNARIGMDSCTAPIFLKIAKEADSPSFPFKDISTMIEPCESSLFSLYVNVDGDVFPCSFMEGEDSWKKGISLLECENFLRDVWFTERIKQWRIDLLNSSQQCSCELKQLCRSCPGFSITQCKKDFHIQRRLQAIALGGKK